MRISMLETAAIGPKVPCTQAMSWMLEVVRAADRSGFDRVWITEHHGVPGIAASAPAVLIAAAAAAAPRLRIGSGGVMLPNHNPYVIAEQFATLAALHPGRIDLGVGRATGGDPTSAAALGRYNTHDVDFASQLDELLGHVDTAGTCDGPLVMPYVPDDPIPVFVLGSSSASAVLAATRGLPYAYAHHLNPTGTDEALRTYRDLFTPQRNGDEPYAIVSRYCVCDTAESDAAAAALDAAVFHLRRMAAGQDGLRSLDELADAGPATDLERTTAEQALGQFDVLISDAQDAAPRLQSFAAERGADEVMVVPLAVDGPTRVTTIESVGRGITPPVGHA